MSLKKVSGPNEFFNLLQEWVPDIDNHTLIGFIGKAMTPEARQGRAEMEEHQAHSIPPSVENESSLSTVNSTLNVSDALNNMEQLITQAKERKRDPLRMKKSLDKAENSNNRERIDRKNV